MSWDFYENKKVKARKEYPCELYENLELADIITRNAETKKWEINPKLDTEYFNFTEQELKSIQDYIDCGFKIAKGELHNHTTGKYDGDFVSFRGNIAIGDICHKFELFEED